MRRWEKRYLGEVCEIKTGTTPSRGNASFWTGGDVPWFTIDDIRKRGRIIRDTAQKVTRQALDETGLTVVPAESILLCCTASLGEFALAEIPLTTNQQFNALTVKNKTYLHPRFLFHYVSTLKGELLELSGKATIDFVSAGKLKSIAISVPPLEEQKRIVAILDEAFEGLDRAAANAKKNLANARELFDSHLNAIFTQKGPDWEANTALSTILVAQPRNGWSPPAEYQTGSGNPVLTLSAVTGFEYDRSRVKWTSVPVNENAHYWLELGELLITRSNTPELVGHVAIYDGNPPRAICPDLIMKMKVDPKRADTRFVYLFLRSAQARTYFTSRAHGASSTMKKISKEMVQNVRVPLPSLPSQSAIVSQLDRINEETRRLECIYKARLQLLSKLKQSILQKAFAGELTAALDLAA